MFIPGTVELFNKKYKCDTYEDAGCINKIVIIIRDAKFTNIIFFISSKSPYFLRNEGIYIILDGYITEYV